MARERGREQAKGKSERESAQESKREREHKGCERECEKRAQVSVSLCESFHSYGIPTSSALPSLVDPRPQLHKSDGATRQHGQSV